LKDTCVRAEAAAKAMRRDPTKVGEAEDPGRHRAAVSCRWSLHLGRTSVAPRSICRFSIRARSTEAPC